MTTTTTKQGDITMNTDPNKCWLCGAPSTYHRIITGPTASKTQGLCDHHHEQSRWRMERSVAYFENIKSGPDTYESNYPPPFYKKCRIEYVAL